MTHPAPRNLQLIPDFETDNPAFRGKVRWIKKRSDPVKFSRRDKKTGKRIVEDLKPNGFASAFLKISGRVYVDVDEFWRIVADQNSRGGR